MIIRNYLFIFRALLYTLCFMLACAANAYDINYSPFQPGKTPKVYPMQRCKVVKTFIDTENDNATWVLLAPKDARGFWWSVGRWRQTL